MNLKAKIYKFFKENTLIAVFGAIVAILIGSLIAFLGKIRNTLFNFFISLLREEHFPIYSLLIVLGVIAFLFYKRIQKIIKRVNNFVLLKSPPHPPETPTNEFFLFSYNAKWKINLVSKSFERNPYCICCNPPNHLLALPVEFGFFQFASNKNTHKCIFTDKIYNLLPEAHVYAYQEARKQYRVKDKDIEDEILKLIKERKQKK